MFLSIGEPDLPPPAAVLQQAAQLRPAGMPAGVPLDAQRPADLRWIREDFIDHRTPFGPIVVHGHTITAVAGWAVDAARQWQQQCQQEQSARPGIAHRASLRATTHAAIRPARTSPSLTAESIRGCRLSRSHAAGPRR